MVAGPGLASAMADFRTQGLDHVAVAVSDLDRSEAFYRDVLGPKKLPEVGRSIGKGMREFKESLNGESQREHDHDDDERPALKTE